MAVYPLNRTPIALKIIKLNFNYDELDRKALVLHTFWLIQRGRLISGLSKLGGLLIRSSSICSYLVVGILFYFILVLFSFYVYFIFILFYHFYFVNKMWHLSSRPFSLITVVSIAMSSSQDSNRTFISLIKLTKQQKRKTTLKTKRNEFRRWIDTSLICRVPWMNWRKFLQGRHRTAAFALKSD